MSGIVGTIGSKSKPIGREYINTGTPPNGEGVFQVKGVSGQTCCVFQIGSHGQKGLLFRDGENDVAGYITINDGAVSYTNTSDYRLKENVVAITDGIDRLKQLNPIRFNFKKTPDNTLDGFLAHEASEVVPEAVSGEKDAVTGAILYVEGDELPEGKSVGDIKEAGEIDPQGIDQSKLVPLLVRALQEAIARIETLESA